MFEKILVATDFSESSRSAWFAAINLASRCLARIEVLHVITYKQYVFDPARYGVPDEKWQNRLKEEMEVQYAPRLYPNSHRTILFSASVPEAILDFAEKEACNLIIVGTHDRKIFGRMLMGSVAQQVVRDSKVQVMVVKAGEHHEKTLQNYDRILVPTDFSEMSSKSLNWAVRYANFLLADLHLLHVVDLRAYSDMITMYSLTESEIPNSCELNVDLSLNNLLQDKDLIGKKFVKSLFGDPVEEIISYAEKENCGFIVMGTHGRKGLERILLGSITAGVISRSKIPIITMSDVR
ncbi:universal stress protein [bacterium]|nr:universal stress protein [bacterium]